MIEMINGKAYVKKGDKVYELGGGGGIDVASAKVGQTIKVKAVDENGKPTEWESADFPEELTVVELTTPIENGAVFTAEECAALSAAAATGKPAIVKGIVAGSPDVVMPMTQFSGVGFVAVFADHNVMLMFDGEAWLALVQPIVPVVTEDDEGKFLQVVNGAYTLVTLKDRCITVATVDDLPTDAEDGTIAIIDESLTETQ